MSPPKVENSLETMQQSMRRDDAYVRAAEKAFEVANGTTSHEMWMEQMAYAQAVGRLAQAMYQRAAVIADHA